MNNTEIDEYIDAVHAAHLIAEFGESVKHIKQLERELG